MAAASTPSRSSVGGGDSVCRTPPKPGRSYRLQATLRGDARAGRSSRGSLRATMPVSVVGVEDHRQIPDGVKAIFDRGSECGAVGESENSAEAVQLCRKSRPDIVLMNIGLLAMTGIEASSELITHCPGIKVIILSFYDDENSAISAIGSRDRACVWKMVSSTELLDALRTVARGGSYLSSRLSDRLLTCIQRGDSRTRGRSPRPALSTRELQVLRPVAQGKTCKDIAVILDLGFETIGSDRKTMTKKLGVNGVALLTQLALAAGFAHGDKLDANSLG
jgi:DNA-binding NarL/FixJ family response regulator